MKLEWVRDIDGDITLLDEYGEPLGWVLKNTDTHYRPHVRRATIHNADIGVPFIEGRFTTARQAMRALRTRVIVLTLGGAYGA